MYIESPQNARIKAWAQLKTKKGRTQQGLFIIEGMRLVEEALASDLTIEAVLWDVGTDELPSHILYHPKCERTFFELSPGAFAEVSETVTPQGVIAIAKIDLAEQGATSQPEFVVLLDGVQDPGNVGTLLRTSHAFGFTEVCCGTGTADPFAPKVVRASMGGLFRLHVSSEKSVAYIQRWRQAHPNGSVVVAAADATSACYDANLRHACLIVIGSEAFGVSPEVAELATEVVSIPMVGEAESLNAAIAGSVLLYESSRQRGIRQHSTT